jgi:signal transduction histidine kinase
MRPVSLQGRLTAILLGLTIAVWLFSAIITAAQARRLIHVHIDRQLAASMFTSIDMMQGVLDDPAVGRYFAERAVTLSADDTLRRVVTPNSAGGIQAINLWFRNTQVVVGSDTPQLPRPSTEGSSTIQLRDSSGKTGRWRVLYRKLPGRSIWIAAGVNLQQAERTAAAMLWRPIVPLLIVLPATTAILIMGVRSGLRPLNELAEKIAARDPLAQEPIELASAPAEIRPVVAALNGLLERLQRALVSEQRFTANAAHELQTPLAAIKAEVQRHQRHAPDLETQQMLGRIAMRVSRATATVTQLLTLARLDPDQRFERQPLDLREALLDVMAELGGVVVDRRITLRLGELPDGATVLGHGEWVHILLRNLMLNAVQHAPADTEVQIDMAAVSDGTNIAISNVCDPIAESDLQRLTDRFFRPADNPAPGVGLGLSIVQRIAVLHGATLQLAYATDQGRFIAAIHFPLPDSRLSPAT